MREIVAFRSTVSSKEYADKICRLLTERAMVSSCHIVRVDLHYL